MDSVLKNNDLLDSDGLVREAVRQARASGANRYLSRRELEAAARAIAVDDSPPALTLSTTHPNASLTSTGADHVLSSDVSGSANALGSRAVATLAFDGHAIDLRASHSGYFSTRSLDTRVPEGYWAEQLGHQRDSGVVQESFRLQRDAPDTLSSAEAIAVARAAIAEHVRATRMHENDWKDFLPSTWPALVAEGIEAGIADFAANPEEDQLYRGPDSYVIVGSGPFELYTEVTISKTSGEATQVYIEID